MKRIFKKRAPRPEKQEDVEEVKADTKEDLKKKMDAESDTINKVLSDNDLKIYQCQRLFRKLFGHNN